MTYNVWGTHHHTFSIISLSGRILYDIKPAQLGLYYPVFAQMSRRILEYIGPAARAIRKINSSNIAQPKIDNVCIITQVGMYCEI